MSAAKVTQAAVKALLKKGGFGNEFLVLRELRQASGENIVRVLVGRTVSVISAESAQHFLQGSYAVELKNNGFGHELRVESL